MIGGMGSQDLGVQRPGPARDVADHSAVGEGVGGGDEGRLGQRQAADACAEVPSLRRMGRKPFEGGAAVDGPEGTVPGPDRVGRRGPGGLVRARADVAAPVRGPARVVRPELPQQPGGVESSAAVQADHAEDRGGAQRAVQRGRVTASRRAEFAGVFRPAFKVIGDLKLRQGGEQVGHHEMLGMLK